MDAVRKILIVDDEPMVLSAFKRAFRSRPEFSIETATTGREALLKLQDNSFHVIMSDLRMPEMNGLRLLEEVARDFPQIVRIILSGETDMNVVTKFPGHAHQFLAKPADHPQITETLQRAIALQRLTTIHPGLNRIIAKVGALPSLPRFYHQMLKALESPESTPGQLGELISQDIAMTSRILQFVNSPFFGLKQTISDPVHAAKLLGLDTIKGLVISSQAFSQFEQVNSDLFSIAELLKHSLRVSKLAVKILQQNDIDGAGLNDAFTAGMLHDIGKLMLTQVLRKEYHEIMKGSSEKKRELWLLEQETLNTTHAELGAYLLALWRLPNAVVEAVAHHHVPGRAGGSANPVVGAIHVANIIAQGSSSATGNVSVPDFDMICVDKIGIKFDVTAFRQLMA